MHLGAFYVFKKMIRISTCNLVYLMIKDILFLVVSKIQTCVSELFEIESIGVFKNV